MPIVLGIIASMEEEQLATIIGKNIMRFRKASNMTQLDLAEKLNYSDKSISKWEQGNAIPDVRILMQMGELFGVSLDDFTRESVEQTAMPKKAKRKRRVLTVIISAGLCWLVAVFVFAMIMNIAPAESPAHQNAWLAFLYAVPASAIVVVVFSALWRWKVTRILSISVLVWTLIAAICVTTWVFGANWWWLFLVGVPLELLAIFYFVLFPRFKKEKS